MSSTDQPAAGRGARKRQQRRAERERKEALSFWSRPGVLLFLAALGLAAVGWLLVFQQTRSIPVREATVAGLELRMLEARWLLDQMDHGENFQKPSVMMPDMPEWGKQRVTLELTMANRSDEPLRFDGAEFVLVPQIGEPVPPVGANVGTARLEPGQAINTAIYFDFDTREPYGGLEIEWRRGGEVVHLPIPEPAEHYHLRPRGGEVALPTDGQLLLPIGDIARGGRLYRGIYGCAACHGDPGEPGTNNVGPHLGDVAIVAEERVEGLPGVQYLYESILDPGAFIAPDCKNGPCEEPSAMPEYASLVSLQDAADLLVYLLEQQG